MIVASAPLEPMARLAICPHDEAHACPSLFEWPILFEARIERLNPMNKCVICDTLDLSDEDFDIHAQVSHQQMSGEELKKMIEDLSMELEAPIRSKGRKRR